MQTTKTVQYKRFFALITLILLLIALSHLL
jgi:hypothetical protein